MNLPQKYRPESWEDFKGSEFAVKILRKMVEAGTLPNCLLFSGPRGTGKTSAARILAKELNGDSGESLSYIEVDAASNNGVENIRQLQEVVKYAHSGKWRIVVLDEAHALSQASFNALLKILEEPPAHTVFVLVTTHPESLPETVRSRATPFRFNNLSIPTIARRLAEVVTKEKLPVKNAKTLMRIAEIADGSLRGALVVLEQVSYSENPSPEDVDILTGNTVNTSDLIYAMLSGNLHELEPELSSVFHSSNDINVMLVNLIKNLKKFHDSNTITNTQFLNCMNVVWSMRKVQASDEAIGRAMVEAGIFAMFVNNFWNGSDERPDIQTAPITEEDLQG